MADVIVQNTQGGQSADVQVSLAEQEAATAAAAAAGLPSATNLGVTDAQFAKYYNPATGYNWQAHATEASFRADKGAADAPTAAAPKTAGDVVTPIEPATDAAAENAISKAGLDFGTLEDQVVNTGTIDDASFAALEGIGIPKEVVADYLVSITDRAAAQVASVIDAFGGDDNLNKVKAYAQEKYTDAEMRELDGKLADPLTYQATVDMLRHGAGILPGSTGTTVTAPNAFGGAADGVAGYANDAEMQVDMRNPLYKTDPVFRQGVVQKVAASTYGNNPRAHSGGL